jgi:hypothetical protein
VIFADHILSHLAMFLPFYASYIKKPAAIKLIDQWNLNQASREL